MITELGPTEMFMRIVLLCCVASVLLMSPMWGFAADSSDSTPPSASEVSSARTALKADKFADAEALLRKAVAKDAGNADAWNLLAYSIRKQGRMDEAEKLYGKALAIDKEHVGALEYLGVLYVQTGRLDKAKTLLARIDDACFFSCDEHDALKDAIEKGAKGTY